MRNLLNILENKQFSYVMKQRLLCKKILQVLATLEKGGKLNTPGKERLLKGSRLIQGFIDICEKTPNRSALDKASTQERKIVLEDLTKKIEVITNGGNTEVGTLKNFFDSLEKYNSVFYAPKGLLSL